MATFAGNGFGALPAQAVASSQSPFGQPAALGGAPAFAAASNPFKPGESQVPDAPSNPFGSATSLGGAASSNPFQSKLPPASPSSNPFLAAGAGATTQSSAAPAFGQQSSFGAPPAPSSAPTASGAFSKPSFPASLGAQASNLGATFGAPATGDGTAFGTKSNWGQSRTSTAPQQQQSNSYFPSGSRPAFSSGASSQYPPPAPKLKAPLPHIQLGHNAEPMDIGNSYASRIHRQLMADKIYPPKWPQNPGDPANKGYMATFREQFKTYRDRARASLIKNGLIDDPDTRRKLSEAIEFKGVCEDMCPEYEKVLRITEHDVKMAEKNPQTSFAQLEIMVKKLARSAAGQEAPLPMDVRSVACIRRTLDYLLDDLMKTEDNLPNTHGFLWDRTRAIRRDFAFFSSMNKDEMLDQIYCLETLTRFHVTALHILSRPGVAPEDFSEQQEVEQLGKSLLSLIYAYDDCRNQGIVCKNEAEFRAYYLVLRAFDTNILDVLESEWNIAALIDSPIIQTALSIFQSLKSPRDPKGPIRVGVGSVAAPFCSFFDIVSSPDVSFTMACFAEIHFGRYRRAVLRGLNKAFARPRGFAKDITAADINKHLRFDTVDECVEFVELHGLTFTPDAAEAAITDDRVLVAQYGQDLDHPRLKNTFSRTMVDKKRGSLPLPHIIRNAVFEAPVVNAKKTIPNGSSSLSTSKTNNAFSSFKTPASSSTSLSAPAFKPAAALAAPPLFGATPSAPSSTFAPPAGSQTSSAPSIGNALQLANPFGAGQNGTGTASSQPQATLKSMFATNKTNAAPTSTSIFSSTPSQPIGVPPSFNFASAATPAVSVPSALVEKPASATAKFSLTGTGATTSGFSAPASTPITGTSTAPSFMPPTSSAATTPATVLPSAPVSAAPSLSFEAATTTAAPPPAPSFSFTSEAKPTEAAFVKTPLTTTAASVFNAPALSLGPELSSASVPGPFSNTLSKPTMQSSILQAPVLPVNLAPSTPTTVQPPTPSIIDLNPGSKLALFSGSSITPIAKAKVDRSAVIDGLTKWYTLGDDGLLQQFYLYMTEEIVKNTFQEFIEEEERRKEEAEAAEDLAKAIKLRRYNLSLRYLQRWRFIARERRLEAIRRSGRDQLRAHQQAQRRERQRAEAALKRKSELGIDENENVRMFYEVAERSKRNLMKINGSLGMSEYGHDRGAIIQEDDVGSVWSVPDAPDAYSAPKSKKAKRRAKGPTSMAVQAMPQSQRSESVASTFSVGGKTQSIMEQYALSRSASLRRSMPSASFSSSQFGRSQFSTPPVESLDKRVSKVSDRWRLKAMGLTTMPNGSILPDHLAHQVLYQKKRYTELGSCGLGPTTRPRRVSAAAADLDIDMRISRAKALLPTTPRSTSVADTSRAAVSPMRVPSGRAVDMLIADTHHRKRSADEALGPAEPDNNSDGCSGLDPMSTPPQSEPMSATKRILLEAQKMRMELRAMRSEMEDGADWLHDETSRLQSQTPGRY
ncbi:uncharacterized protein BROUX77_004287 [Berkeleyomyces rouxiae]|uniref:uncharacterized protein n=1 Tax=Berkeleyomyces rouxiae TaxID=2035830 RepID=UPI003B7C5F3D